MFSNSALFVYFCLRLCDLSLGSLNVNNFMLRYIIHSKCAVSFAFYFVGSSVMLTNQCPYNISFCEGKGIEPFNDRA